MIDYTQRNEQPVILNYFGSFRGTFLDLGANDGVTFSNSRALALLEWSGVCVEPSEAAFKKLCENSLSGALRVPAGKTINDIQKISQNWLRKDGTTRTMTLLNAAITPKDGPIALWESGTHLKKGDVGLLSTTIPQERHRWAASGEQFRKVMARGITIQTLMKETGVSKFDFISIDVEGADYDVMRQINLSAVGCRMLCVETNNQENRKFVDYAQSHGLRLVARNLINLVFAK